MNDIRIKIDEKTYFCIKNAKWYRIRKMGETWEAFNLDDCGKAVVSNYHGSSPESVADAII